MKSETHLDGKHSTNLHWTDVADTYIQDTVFNRFNDHFQFISSFPHFSISSFLVSFYKYPLITGRARASERDVTTIHVCVWGAAPMRYPSDRDIDLLRAIYFVWVGVCEQSLYDKLIIAADFRYISNLSFHT